MKKIKALVLTGFGLNCDYETAYSLELAGAEPKRIHINYLIENPSILNNYKIFVFGGGFSWGDDHGAGVLQAVRLKTNMEDELKSFISSDNLILGICNGFQTLVNIGLLPGINQNYNFNERKVALTFNECGNFRNDWVSLKVNESSPCVFTKDIKTIDLPIRHGEGKFITDNKNTLDNLFENNQIVMQYAIKDGNLANGTFPDNPNGSVDDIAGICDFSGKIFGLMPHPEAYNIFANHPNWCLKKEEKKRFKSNCIPKYIKPEEIHNETLGIKIFKNAVKYFL